MKETLVSISEKSFTTDCINANCRSDGRRNSEARKVDISLGPTWGFAEVSFDSTRAVASTTVDAITPPPDRPSDGNISISVQLSPTASEPAARDSLFRNSGSFLETRICIESFIRDSRAVDTEALCILAGVKVWSVRVDVDIINDDGNCMDVCMLAVMASLMHARRPDVSVTGKEVRIFSMDEREAVPLPIHHVPLCMTFALFGPGKPFDPDTVVLDPVKTEELSSGGAISFAFNSQGEVCGVYKAGGLGLQLESFEECANVAASRARQLTGRLKCALDDASAQHPLSTVRPMLVDAEPVAMLMVDKLRADERLSERASVWNATPMVDSAPPDMDGVEMNVRSRAAADSGAVESVFERKEAGEAMGIAKKKDVVMGEGNDNKMVVEKLLESESDSSSDDLEAAIVVKKQGKSGKKKRR
ncbi:unnamed protein product [Agarophyton chilense]|eukprot:gb/GEZJ01003874.1/.p1 GENE.gb/GEZJ01003874.1/~~gb/GEZJ01003874.1/.p1  ORF type:complete len:418 (-),score=77.97 gb/GEZJ01003874.1/:983-2236(-)